MWEEGYSIKFFFFFLLIIQSNSLCKDYRKKGTPSGRTRIKMIRVEIFNNKNFTNYLGLAGYPSENNADS